MWILASIFHQITAEFEPIFFSIKCILEAVSDDNFTVDERMFHKTAVKDSAKVSKFE